MKEIITYILKHKPSGFYVQNYSNDLTLTDNRSKAKEWEVNAKHTPEKWQELVSTGEYAVIKRTETTTTEYKEVKLDDI